MSLDELEAENRELKNEILRLSSDLASMNKQFDTLNFYHDKICKQSRIKEDLLRNLLYTSSIPFYKKYFFKLKLWLIRKCL